MVPGGGGPNNPNNFLTLPAAGAPGGGRRSGSDDQQSSSKENKPDQVAWAAKILQEYTNTKGNYPINYLIIPLSNYAKNRQVPIAAANPVNSRGSSSAEGAVDGGQRWDDNIK